MGAAEQKCREFVHCWRRKEFMQLMNVQIPHFSDPDQYDIPECERPNLAQVVNEFPELFTTKSGKTTAEYHYIPTTGCPVKVLPHRILS